MTDDTLPIDAPARNTEDYTNALSWLLPNGRSTIIDIDTIPLMLAHKWRAHPTRDRKTMRVMCHSTGTATNYLHREIMGNPTGKVVDHKNRNPSDNRARNLRVCTRRENSINAPGNANGTSRYKGVSWNTQQGKWVATVHCWRTPYHLGLFASEVEAARAYNAVAREMHGEFAFLNPV